MESSSWLLKNEGLRHLWHPPLQFLQVATTCMHGHGRVPYFVKALWPTTHTSDTELMGGHPTDTTGDAAFPECLIHSGRHQNKHSGKASMSATLGEGLPGMLLTGKPSTRAKLPLGDNLTPSTSSLFLPLSPECNTRGRNSFFLETFSPSATLWEEFCFF
jgi:hypothetical protein